MRTSPRAQDVADLAEVSQSAVSRTFTPGASVSEETRRKVLAAAQKLGYRPNALARSLITRRSRIVALVMSYLENQFYPLVIEKLSQKLQKEGYHVLMFIAEVDEAADGVLAEILQYQVDGIVMASAMLSPNIARSCAEVGVPVVQFNRISMLGGLARHASSSVTSDNHAGGALAAQLLVQRGYRRFGFLAGLRDSSTSIERERGFRDALRQLGHEVHRREAGDYNFDQAQAATRRLFQQDAVDALFVANDHMAIAALDVLRLELKLRVPEDVGVVGFDDVPQAAWGAYRLTTVRQPLELMVDATVGLLREQMQAELRPRDIVVPCVMVERATVRPGQDLS
ncbi:MULTISPECIES: LacI family DNA-binding transcriptional regulator [unclassified Achromobacter]|uniref:LacI family DNA-binding transcriptional regulator n=1 Tax=unclassified Achromobacter TaxID=2626865 RepID=UPI000B5158E0|nr:MULTISPECIES: LacI family DNA-binding transcriptional regulator [unclassified Achromobacter]OWT81067.1 LacI family transcriptional regulator [Achromobacter sp. HZ34]OWT82568.1 LacI family transcriptional regulator [Achromobacter sp. HZ28]